MSGAQHQGGEYPQGRCHLSGGPVAVVPGGPESAGRELYPQPHGGMGRSGHDHPVSAGDPAAAGKGGQPEHPPAADFPAGAAVVGAGAGH